MNFFDNLLRSCETLGFNKGCLNLMSLMNIVLIMLF
jgi:hypothetical protein